MKNKIEIKKFLGMEVRVVNNEYIALKDMFMALGRVRSNGGWTDEKTKLKNIIGEENIVNKCLYLQDKSGKIMRRNVKCSKIKVLEQYDIIGIFGKNGVIYTNYREEYSFINNVRDFFKYDEYIKINTQVKCMEFNIDLMIGNCVAIEYDENYHKNLNQNERDIIRMKKICLSYGFDGKNLHNTNDYEDLYLDKKEYEDFVVYEANGFLFIRIFDKKCINWIPIVYRKYDEFIDFMGWSPRFYNGNSEDLKKLSYSC